MKDNPRKLEGLVQSLNLVPYLQKHPGATPMEVARDLGMSNTQVMSALQRLRLSGVGQGPGEMIDLVADWSGVTIVEDQGLNRPLRPTPTEANALLLTLESLETMPGLIDHAAVTSAAAKLRNIMKTRAVPDTIHPAEAGPAATVAEALMNRKQLSLEYYSASSDTTSRRIVSPERLFHQDGNTYLKAWEGEREKTFRLDRIRQAEMLDDDSLAKRSTFDDQDPFGFGEEKVAELRLRDSATWLIDYWQIDLGERMDNGWWSASMPYGSAEWLIRFSLSQADRLKVISPQAVSDEVFRRAKEALQSYDSSTGHS
ncbi:WYL domain-containing protein [Corynebacterium breve]|uniref:WYL domain-containing protein n=1 Tax=Corynebacterium breve TaxID=3049799 RepID=A0ABY8VGP0_9CORY|nr:WYL domain-containing protein [Corynebacterium breve]WIM68836.1 WYL domain-containing protein [Corynebacterium breve]